MFLERFKEVENFTVTKLPLGGSKKLNFKLPIIRLQKINSLSGYKESNMLVQNKK